MFAIITALLVGSAFSRIPSRIVMLHDPVNPDLPCPWCKAATFEQDRSCSGCGQIFG